MHLRLLALAVALLPTLAAPAAERPTHVDLRRWQTPIRSQHGQNCFIYATVAALEARLHRDGHGALDLSEAFSDYFGALFFLETCAMDGRFRTRTLRVPAAGERETSLAVDFQPTIESATPVQRLGIPEERYFSWRAADHQPPGPAQSTDPYWSNQFKVSSYNLDPRRLTRAALTAPRYYRVQAVEWLPREDAQRPEAIEAVLAAGREVIWDFRMAGDYLSSPWRFTTPAGMDVSPHRMLLVGYDRRDPRRPFFIAKNSWGPTTNAGAQGFTLISYDYLRYGEWASSITAVTRPQPWPELRALGRRTLTFGPHSGTLDLYHLPGQMQQVFTDNNYRDARGQPLPDRRLGTFYRDDDPAQPFRVNGDVDARTLRLFIDFNQPAARWDQTNGWRIELVGVDREWRFLKGDAWEPGGRQHPAEAALLADPPPDPAVARELEAKRKAAEDER